MTSCESSARSTRRKTARPAPSCRQVRLQTGLPGDADATAGAVDAELAEGVLTVRVPKSERARSRRIEVKT
ncbi:Hsp20 family protein [Spirillospora sp. CA-142024]|uniref:Hsp20 family protein n=1 Tax=Spirillospora sp. CA-142024 TaxID=3240036 RepID=UPI003D89D1F3